MPIHSVIADRCPACGSTSLFIGSGGWLTCAVIGCKEPAVSAAWEKERASLTAKVVVLRSVLSQTMRLAYDYDPQEPPLPTIADARRALADTRPC